VDTQFPKHPGTPALQEYIGFNYFRERLDHSIGSGSRRLSIIALEYNLLMLDKWERVLATVFGLWTGADQGAHDDRRRQGVDYLRSILPA
jgi:hypothetical protein